ncbi:2OG-Fe(II) oxygenase [Oculatella sp. LEGE 06141]|uniref:2OG-Fe(II) oxygenase n=1 Tax=Oculatella sp. LEGE 06141 TaxID=1828648 RepID=UPI00351CB1C8
MTLLLSGGHEYTLPIQTDAPLLQQLFEVIMEPEIHATRLFQVPIRKGRGVVCFRGDRLVGLVTEPPLVIQQQPPNASEAVLSSTFVQLDNFLTAEQQKQLIHYTLQQEGNFVATNTSTGEREYRKSVVLHTFPEYSELISQRIKEVLPYVLTRLSMPTFSIAQIEAQLTGHNDGQYYRVHNDNGSPETATRELTYVYYFHREPKSFSGGELIIYDSKIENNYYVQADSFKTIEPRNNSIVFFPSYYMHEVLPIQCPSRTFADSRFTINGWIRRPG